MSQIDNLINTWRRVDTDERPLVLPEDRPYVLRGKRSVVFDSYEQWLAGGGLKGLKSDQLHLGLVPVPYIGDLKHASVVILMLNPGLEADDYYAETPGSAYRDAIIRNLRQEVNDTAYPFVFLDPQFAWHSTGKYWRARLAWLADELVGAQASGSTQALQLVSKHVVCLQLVPYHSATFGLSHDTVRTLPSAALVRGALSELLAQAQRGEKLIVAMRRSGDWGLAKETLCSTVLAYSGPATRAAYINKGNTAGQRIRDFLLGHSAAV
ncbi:MAG: hypothetical protein H0U60_12930 [Blastocatellia bacterium]|nr:hypothetical protein [Blastocatellia bacterium]